MWFPAAMFLMGASCGSSGSDGRTLSAAGATDSAVPAVEPPTTTTTITPAVTVTVPTPTIARPAPPATSTTIRRTALPATSAAPAPGSPYAPGLPEPGVAPDGVSGYGGLTPVPPATP